MNGTSKPIRFIIGCLVFVLTLMILGTVVFDKYIKTSDLELTHQIIFDISAQGQDPEIFEQTLTVLQQNLNATAGVVSTTFSKEVSAQKHVFLTARLAPQVAVSQEELLSNLRQIYPNIALQSQTLTTSLITQLHKTLLVLSMTLMIFVATAIILSISLVTRTGLSMQKSVIDILRLIGSPNSFIARQFQWFTFRMSFFSSIMGMLLAFGCFVSLSLFSNVLGISINLRLMSQELIILIFCLPLSISLLALMVARIEVIRTLIRLDTRHP